MIPGGLSQRLRQRCELTSARAAHLAANLCLAFFLVACGGGAYEDRPTSTVAVPTSGSSAPPAVQPVESALPALPTASPTVPTPPAPLAALVNGDYIFLEAYELQLAQYELGMVEAGLDPESEEGQAELSLMRREVLEAMIDYVLIEQAGAALGVTLSDAELEDQLEADIAAGGGEAAFDEWLEATGLTRDDYKEMLRESLSAQRVMDTVTADLPTTAEQVHARQIVVDREETAKEILGQLQEGADFEALARERSVDAETKDAGGDLGWFPRGVVDSELERAAFALQPGETSDPVRVGEQFYLVQVVEREPARELSLEAALDLQRAAFEQWLAELRQSSDIERFVEE